MQSTIRNQLVRDEGLRFKAYEDSLGKLTVGVGRCLDTNPLDQTEMRKLTGSFMSLDGCNEYLVVVGISEESAMWLLDRDIASTIGKLLQKYAWMGELDDARLGAFTNMGFQLGINGLSKFKHMLKAAEVSHWQSASAEALDSKWAKQTPDRAARVALQLFTGAWQ